MQSDVRQRLGIADQRYGLVTLHRPANVDDDRKRTEILEALSVISGELMLLWPLHPRTRARLESGSFPLPPRIRLLEPLGYFDFLRLQAESSIVLTDSGGIQEETTVLGVPCLTLRENTERPITIECGTNRLAGTTKDSILQAWRTVLLAPPKGVLPPLWDGKAGERCHAVLSSYFQGGEK
jgi:UDP-N-acetylglucosamine 2-epimerase (non-hydrolysing)